MIPITLDRLFAEPGVKAMQDGLSITIQEKWVVFGEKRLSYSTAVKLVECCREYHWNKDILSIETDYLDSTVRSFTADFNSPIFIGDNIYVSYYVFNVGFKSYKLQVDLIKDGANNPSASFYLVSVFLDSSGKPCMIPQAAKTVLNKKKQSRLKSQ